MAKRKIVWTNSAKFELKEILTYWTNKRNPKLTAKNSIHYLLKPLICCQNIQKSEGQQIIKTLE